MNVEAFILCDAATDYQGKLNVLGAYDTIMCNQVPFVQQGLVFAARIRFRLEECGIKNFEILTMDYDGKSVLPKFQVRLEVKLPENRDSGAVNIIVNVQSVTFSAVGKFRIDLLVDGKITASLPLEVIKNPNAV